MGERGASWLNGVVFWQPSRVTNKTPIANGFKRVMVHFLLLLLLLRMYHSKAKLQAQKKHRKGAF